MLKTRACDESSRVVKATALKNRGRELRARDLSCSDEDNEKQLCENVDRLGDQWTLPKSDISRVINCAQMMWNGLGRSDS